MEIMFLNPVFKEMIWGGNRMRKEYGYDIPGEDTGECWAISAHPNGDGVIANGIYAGWHLSKLWAEHRELFGNQAGDVFPLLTKIIDAKNDLSIQVHPDDTYAKEHENGSLGKMECWYILDCDKDATIVIGHHANTKEELKQMIADKQCKDLIREIPIQKGDFFQIAPGTVHAIKGGTLILETQQNSDITYRLYDYDRLQNGKPRPLHIEQSIDVIKVPFCEPELHKERGTTRNTWWDTLVSCEYYTVWKAVVNGTETLCMEHDFLLGSCIEGTATIGDVSIQKGDHFILPSGFPQSTVTGNATLIFSTPSCIAGV